MDAAINSLRELPAAMQEEAFIYIERLHVATPEQRVAALRQTAGCLADDEVERFEKTIRECCEQVDE
jgi:hypothetical protein